MRINEDYLDITDVEQSLDDIKVDQEVEFDGRFYIIYIKEERRINAERNKVFRISELIRRAERVFENSIFVKNHSHIEVNEFSENEFKGCLSCNVTFNFRTSAEILKFINTLLYITFNQKKLNISIAFETETDFEEISNVFYSIDYETIFKNRQRDPISNFKSIYKLCRLLMPDRNTLPSLSKALDYDYIERFETHALKSLSEKYDKRFKCIDSINISKSLKLNFDSIKENFGGDDCILSKGNALANYVTNFKEINSYNINELEKTQTVSRASYGVVLDVGLQHNFLDLYLDELPLSGDWTEGTISYMLTIVYPTSMNPEEVLKLVTF